MTEQELTEVVRGIAPVIQAAVRAAVADLQGRLDPLAAMSPRVLALEARSAVPGPPGRDGKDGRDGTDAEATAAVGELRSAVERLDRRLDGLETVRERIAVLETRAPVPGPAGQDGQHGQDGRPGVDGLGFDDLDVTFDGDRTLAVTFRRGTEQKAFPIVLPFLRYQGVYHEATRYVPGDVVTWAGSTWHCTDPTTQKPGEGQKAWTLIVKRGRDGKDGRDGPRGPDGPAGKDWQQVYDAVRSR